jgi:O-antigen ligase
MSETILYKPEDVRPMLTAAMTASWVLAAALIWFFSPWSAVFLVLVGTVVMIARLPLSTAVVVFILLIPFDFQREIGGMWVYLDLLVAAIALPLLRLKKRPPTLCWLLVPFFLYFVATGAPRSLVPLGFLRFAVRWVIALCFSAAVAMSGAAEELVLAAGVTLIPLTAYGLYQLSVGDFGWLFAWMNPEMIERPWMARSYSLMWHPNAFGEFAGMISVMLIALGLKGYKTKLFFTLAAVGIAGLLCAGSRGADIGVGIAILVLLTQTPKYWRKLAVIAVLAFIIWGAQHYDIIPLERVEGLDEPTTNSRLLVWGAAYTGWQQHPWIGLGTKNFVEIMQNFVNFTAVHAHSTYLQILAETGLVGFALFYLPLLYLLRRAWKARTVPVVLAGACALLVWLAHGFVDVTFLDNPPNLLLLFTVIGLIISGLPPRNTLQPAESEVS